MAHVLVVETQASVRLALRRFLEGRGHTCDAVDTLGPAPVGSNDRSPDLVVLDPRTLPSETAPELNAWLRERAVLWTPEPPAAAPAALASHPRASQLDRPIDFAALDDLLPGLLTGPRAVEVAPLDTLPPDGTLLHQSAPMAELWEKIEKVAPHDMPVLVTGESGTGKELVARALHECSPRRAEPFSAIHCGAIPGTLLETELFGHERGAFTDAHRTRAGRFEAAGGGTLLLDEIGEMPLELQAKLLRVIQEREVVRVGGQRPIPVRARLIAATHRDLEAEVAAGRFRLDLFHRIAVVTLCVPPLRERLDDLRLLAALFLARAEREFGREIAGLSPDAAVALESHPWPGNVRELENVLRRAAVMEDAGVIEAAHVAPLLAESAGPDGEPAWARTARDWIAREIAQGRPESEVRERLERWLGLWTGSRPTRSDR